MKPLSIEYTNWRGEKSKRRIIPDSIYFGSNKFHPQAGWLIGAIDEETGKYRTFAINEMIILDE